jgi:antitoxin Phd
MLLSAITIMTSLTRLINMKISYKSGAEGGKPLTSSVSWQLQSAKARFSEVFRKARTEGPQRITKQGKEAVVMIAEEQFQRLAGKSRQPRSLVDFLRRSPLRGVNLERDRDPGRDIDL